MEESGSRMKSLSNSSTRSAANKEEKSDGSVSHKNSFTQDSSKEDELESARAKMKEVREENARLKMMLQKIEEDYKALQKRFVDNVDQQEANTTNNTKTCTTIEDTEEPEFISLRLGTSPTTHEPKRETDSSVSSFSKSTTTEDQGQLKCGLKLGLDYHLGESKSDPTVAISPENSLEEQKDEHDQDANPGENWPPSKVVKTVRSEDDEISQQPNPKRARVSVRVRCDTPTMNDGCQWRKYGQKIAKGNPCPRAYYRCTVAPACPVRKQVQRCAEDMSILITTYEGTHNHPLTVSATAMASTTSAAASMLLSGSSSSQPGLGLTPATTRSTNLHGLNVNLNQEMSRTRPFCLPNTSTPTFPTITLDLTSTTPFNSPFNIHSSTNFQSNPISFPSKNLNFSSFESNNAPSIWGNGYMNSYGKLPYNKPPVGLLNLGGQEAQEQLYHSYLGKNNQQPLTETITKVLTSDPSFQSVIAAAISSMVRGGSGTQGGGESCLIKSSSSSTQTGSMNAVQPTSFPFSVSKSTSATKDGDQTKS